MKKLKTAKGDWNDVQINYVSLSIAREYARQVEDYYREKVVSMSDQRFLTNTTLIGIAASALGLAATGGATGAISALGVSGAGVGMFGSQLPNSLQKQIYTQGKLALECVVKAASTSVQATFPQQTAILNVYYKHLNEAQNNIEEVKSITEPKCQVETNNQKSTIEKAKNYFSKYGEALDLIDPRGQILVNAVDSIRANVDDELSKAEPELIAFNSALKSQINAAAMPFIQNTSIPGTKGLINETDKISLAIKSSCTDDLSKSAVSKLDNSIKQLINDMTENVSLHVETYPTLNFSACALANPDGNGPLRADTNSYLFIAGQNSISINIRGGTPPYKVDSSFAPPPVNNKKTVEITAGSAFKDGQTYQVVIDGTSIPNGNSFVLIFNDNTGTSIPITFKKAN